MKKLPSDCREWKKILLDWKKGENLKDIYIYHTGFVSDYSLILEAFTIGILININEYDTDLKKLSFCQELK
ncbi:MAG: hypothetical protein PHF86_00100 [Candidatus Nanoarchaeia archaeon]|nr:hypothetical protein [Candidatus Nanoarchaeia archaeon]